MHAEIMCVIKILKKRVARWIIEVGKQLEKQYKTFTIR